MSPELKGVEQQVVGFGACGGRLRQGGEFGQRAVGKRESGEQRGALRVKFGGELLARLLVGGVDLRAQPVLVELCGDVLAVPGKPDDHLQRLGDAVGDQHGVAIGGGVQHGRTGAQEVRAARVVPGDGLQRRSGCEVDVFQVVRPVDVEIEGERREGGQFGAGAEQAENAVGHAEQA
ncbi:hypothetical protein ACFQ7W_19575 [Streptomyces niveus]|uniref:hypothetical protein n=1 Tax=Streptomyces niveus TaxID=193462 RepID=UPI0036970C90